MSTPKITEASKTRQRPPLPRDVEHEVIIRSRRRCCLCFGLNFDTSYKRIQIAHLDHNNANNKADNLAALCQTHHDEYDSRPSQTKGLTAKEVKHHREQLYSTFEQKHQQLLLSEVNKSLEKQMVAPSAQLLGQVLAAYDADFERSEKGARVTGLELAHLAELAAKEKGDFAVAIEAFTSLISLAGKSNSSWDYGLGLREPRATPVAQGIRVLKCFAELDFELVLDTLRKATSLAIFENKRWEDVTEPIIIPHKTIHALTTILAYFCRDTQNPQIQWAMHWVAGDLYSAVGALALSMAYRGIPIPDSPKYLTFGMYGRSIAEGTNEEVQPFVECCYNFALIRSDIFDKVIKNKCTGAVLCPKVDVENGRDLGELLKGARLSSIGLSHALIIISCKSENDLKKCKAQLEVINELANNVGEQVRQYAIAEHGLLTNRIKPTFPQEIIDQLPDGHPQKLK